MDQVEFADVILLNKADLVSKEELKKLYGIIRSLNADAKIIETIKSQVELDEILNTNLFNFEKAADAPGWLKVMRGEEHAESDEYGVSSISFNARNPFTQSAFINFYIQNSRGFTVPKAISGLHRNQTLWRRWQLLEQSEFSPKRILVGQC